MSYYDAMYRDAAAECSGCARSDANGVPSPKCPYWRDPKPEPCDKVKPLAIKGEAPYQPDGSPSGGMVDTRHSKCLASQRPGSSPGKGTSSCQACGAPGAERYHQRTQYHDEESNWVTLCGPCREENDAYWDERWAEYYAGCL